MKLSLSQSPSAKQQPNFARYCRHRKLLIDRCGELHPIRNQSLKVLQLLADNHDTILTRDAIHTAVWNKVAVTDDSLIQCISELRKALGDKDRAILKTFPRQGYLLSQDAFAPMTVQFTVKPNMRLRSLLVSNQTRAVLAAIVLFLSAQAILIEKSTIAESVNEKIQIGSNSTAGWVHSGELGKRAYRESGMPYWNNQFLWDGYYPK